MSACSVVHDYPSALEFLFQRINYERTSHIPYRTGEFKLDRMRELMRRLGNPQHSLPVVHVAGTKGKGSTASMIAAILSQAGYKTGLYTSPHLQHVEERYVVDGEQISPAELVRLVQSLEAVVQELDQSRADDSLRGPTFFEITTAMAFLYFRSIQADVAVLEVGLGGRLDSTNVCEPVVCAITSISYDHTKQLGNTLTAIAREKAGIIKSGVPVVSSVTNEEPREVIREIAKTVGAPLWQRDEQFFVDYSDAVPASPKIDFYDASSSNPRSFLELTTNMRGEHQAANAGTAIAAVNLLVDRGWKVSETDIRAGLMKVRCPARIELVCEHPPVILDTAHNVASTEALCREIERAFAGYSSRTLIFATSRDKDAKSMLKRLVPLFSKIVLTRYVNNPRARTVEELVELTHEVCQEVFGSPEPMDLWQEPDPLSAWRRVHENGGDELICITGSFFLAAELRDVVKQKAEEGRRT